MHKRILYKQGSGGLSCNIKYDGISERILHRLVKIGFARRDPPSYMGAHIVQAIKASSLWSSARAHDRLTSSLISIRRMLEVLTSFGRVCILSGYIRVSR